jgi:predicted acylesterase/phospholipase RssA
VSQKKKKKSSTTKIGLALAGGGPEGAIYEIGALRALDEALDGIDFNDLHVYVGVSAGSFIAACLANNLTTTQMCRAILSQQPGEHPFAPEIFFKPAVGELARRGLMTPGLLVEAIQDYLKHPDELTLIESLTRLARALPVGIFDNEPIRAYLERIYSVKDRTDDFRKLDHRLLVVASDLDSGQAVRFGEGELADVPISTAVQASTALPAIYPPVLINDRYYVDGVLHKTVHASVAIEAGADLLMCVNPIVPVDTAESVDAGVMKHGKLVYRGLPTVLSQTFRTLIHSRLTVGMAAYAPRFPDVDVVLFEPRKQDYRMFFTNIFRFSSRMAVCEHAYTSTRQDLLTRREELEPLFEAHGIRVKTDVLEDPTRSIWHGVGLDPDRRRADVTEKLSLALARLEERLT